MTNEFDASRAMNHHTTTIQCCCFMHSLLFSISRFVSWHTASLSASVLTSLWWWTEKSRCNSLGTCGLGMQYSWSTPPPPHRMQQNKSSKLSSNAKPKTKSSDCLTTAQGRRPFFSVCFFFLHLHKDFDQKKNLLIFPSNSSSRV